MVNEIVEPVRKNQAGCTFPADQGHQVLIIVGKVVVGPVNVQSFALVPKIFFGQCISVVFTVPGREEVAALHIRQQADTGNITVCQDLQVLYLGNVLP